MLLIKNIEIINVPYSEAEIISFEKEYMDCCINNKREWKSIGIIKELVVGRTFINTRGERIVIGASKGVQDAIGLPFEAFDNMSKRSIEDTELIYKLMDKIDKIKRMKLWDRLNFLFRKIEV